MTTSAARRELKDWAEESFGHAALGDRRRVDRLVAMAAAVASRPAGTVTSVFTESAEREGAFRWLESELVEAAEVARASHVATARRCTGARLVYVAMDPSSLTLTDRAGHREIGRVGGFRNGTLVWGLHMMNALAVDEHGAPVGLLDQRWWSRDEPPPPKRKNRPKSHRVHFSRKETRFWVESLLAVDELLKREAAGVTPWFQLDRAGDCWAVLQTVVERSLLVTIRSAYSRRLAAQQGRPLYLREHLLRQRVLGTYEVQVAARPGREARTARMSVRACTVTIELKVSKKRRVNVRLQACLAREVNAPKNDRIEWCLLTTHPIATFEDACKVIEGYTQRWCVEELHRAWKGGVCNVEQTQLHSRQAIIKWATIHAAVAARALRLAHLARTTPDVPAATEFTPYEIDAAFLLAKRKRDRRKKILLSEMIDLVAQEGGFAGKYSGRLPGAQVLARGLERIATLARGLQNLEEM